MARILLVIDNLEFGGGERVFLQLVDGLKTRFEFSVAAMSGGTFEVRTKELGIKFFPLDMTRQLTFKPIRQIRNIIRQNKIDIVHSQGARADFFARLSGKIADSPHILCTVAMPVEGFDVPPVKKKIYWFMDLLSQRYVDCFIVVSDALRKTLTESWKVPTTRVVRIYNGIEIDQYHPNLKETGLRYQWGIHPAAPLIGAIGRMVWQKGFQYLIEAAPKILEVVPEARFLLVGKGPLRPRLENIARELNVHEKVIFTGFRSDIRELLSAIDILAVPSLLEGFPMITLEAMAMARPIVATQIQGVTEQIAEGQEGILVPPRNPNEIARAMLRLIEDKELGTRLGAAARRKIESCFSIDKMVKETEQVYLSLLKWN